MRTYSIRATIGVARVATVAGLLIALSGCGTTRQSDTPRTAIEQLLISTAVDQALQQVDFSPLGGRDVYVEQRYLDCVDKNYIVASVRYHLLLAGARVKEKREEADVVLELRAGAVGTDREDLLIGLNKIPLPQVEQIVLPLTLPDAPLITKSAQKATVKLGMVAYDAKTGQLFADAGLQVAVSDHQQWIILGLGPIRSGSVHREVRKLQGRNTLFARIEGLLFDGEPKNAQEREPGDVPLVGELLPATDPSSDSASGEKTAAEPSSAESAETKKQ